MGLNCARVARSFLVMSFSESLIGCGRSSNTIFLFIFDSLVDCVSVNWPGVLLSYYPLTSLVLQCCDVW